MPFSDERGAFIDWRAPHRERETFAALVLVVRGSNDRVIKVLAEGPGGFLPVDLLPSERDAA